MDPLDPKLLSELQQRAKQQLRKRSRSLRLAHPEAARAQRSARLVTRLLGSDAFQSARAVALFWPLLERGEIDLRAADGAARAAGKRVYYPFLEERDSRLVTGFRLTESSAELAPGRRNFWEPPEKAPLAARGDIDLVVVPALAAASDGHRLGYGLGYYDATLPDVCPPARSVVVVYDFELLAELPARAEDVPCDFILTDQRMLEASPGPIRI